MNQQNDVLVILWINEAKPYIIRMQILLINLFIFQASHSAKRIMKNYIYRSNMNKKRSNTIFLVIKQPVKSYKNLQIEKLPSFAFQKTKQTNNVANHEALSIRTKKKKIISM